MPPLHVPESEYLVYPARDGLPPVRSPLDAGDRVLVSAETPDLPPAFGLPQEHGVVPAAGDDAASVG